MAKPAKEYQRLPGLGTKVFVVASGRSRLWLGPDHLLLVTSQWYTETYKRFYYRDIQALTLRKTSKGKIINATLGSFALFFLSFAAWGFFAWGWGEVGWIICGTMAGSLLVLLAINMLLGPTTVGKIQTAVHAEELLSLNRLWQARRALRLIQAKIEEAQGIFDAKDLLEYQDRIYATAPRNASVAVRGLKSVSPELIKPYNGRFHEWLFYLLLLDGLSTIPLIYLRIWGDRSSTLQTVSALITFFWVLCMIGALVQQHRTDLSRGLKAITWSSLGLICSMMLFGMVYRFILAIQAAADDRSTSDTDFLNHPGMVPLGIFSMLACFGLGVAGLILMRQFRCKAALSSVAISVTKDLSPAE